METLPRGIYTAESKRPLLVTPNSAQLARIAQIPNVEYFSTLGDETVFLPEETEDLMIPPKGYEAFFLRNLFGQYLMEKVEKDNQDATSKMGDGLVGIRGTACSLDGHLNFKRKHIANYQAFNVEDVDVDICSVEEIAEGNSDSGGAFTGVEPVDLRNQKRSYPIGENPNRYLFLRPTGLRQLLARDGREEAAVFPLLVIYNLDFYDYGYKVKLPSEPEKRREAVLKAYLLDYPVSKYRPIPEHSLMAHF